ncbi:hypothetical protein Tco_0727072 [Tanacetum coccineum]|uniref:Uncharacterized protein n=1 Tax=Tanacetum coccineum TaxID=301880 RepID=A0ABQ4YJM6_9ASTR
MSLKNVEEESTKSDYNDETTHVPSFTVESSARRKSEIRKEELIDLLGPEVVNKKGLVTLKVYREDDTSKIIPEFKASDLHLGEWREVVTAFPNKKGKGSLSEQDPLDRLNDLANKKRKHADDIHDFFTFLLRKAWKAKAPSIGGRLTLVKSVLGSLPIYYLSLFKAPKKVINLLESIRSRFFWGFKESQQGISWVKWNSILLKSSMGGLGVGSLLAKNIGLLGKWKWRFLTENDALWRPVIKEFYGECGGFGSLARSRGPNGIWCDIIKAVEDIERIDPSFKRSFHIKVSNGANVSFWKDPWCENGTRLMDLFPRLYALDSFQDCKIGYGECYRLGFNAITHGEHRFSYPDSTDRWSWSKDASSIYKVSTLSNTFQSISLADCNLGVHHKWNSWIP